MAEAEEEGQPLPATIHDIPHSLLTHILCRLPPRSTAMARLACTLWNRLLSPASRMASLNAPRCLQSVILQNKLQFTGFQYWKAFSPLSNSWTKATLPAIVKEFGFVEVSHVKADLDAGLMGFVERRSRDEESRALWIGNPVLNKWKKVELGAKFQKYEPHVLVYDEPKCFKIVLVKHDSDTGDWKTSTYDSVSKGWKSGKATTGRSLGTMKARGTWDTCSTCSYQGTIYFLQNWYGEEQEESDSHGPGLTVSEIFGYTQDRQDDRYPPAKNQVVAYNVEQDKFYVVVSSALVVTPGNLFPMYQSLVINPSIEDEQHRLQFFSLLTDRRPTRKWGWQPHSYSFFGYDSCTKTWKVDRDSQMTPRECLTPEEISESNVCKRCCMSTAGHLYLMSQICDTKNRPVFFYCHIPTKQWLRLPSDKPSPIPFTHYGEITISSFAPRLDIEP